MNSLKLQNRLVIKLQVQSQELVKYIYCMKGILQKEKD